jgi:hypothetical protein
MKVRIIYNSKFANLIGKNITLYPFIFMLADEATSRNTYVLNHEWIHITQIRQLGFFKFYLTYLFKYFKNLIKYKSFNAAYMEVSYEQEAYAGQNTFELPEVLE